MKKSDSKKIHKKENKEKQFEVKDLTVPKIISFEFPLWKDIHIYIIRDLFQFKVEIERL